MFGVPVSGSLVILLVVLSIMVRAYSYTTREYFHAMVLTYHRNCKFAFAEYTAYHALLDHICEENAKVFNTRRETKYELGGSQVFFLVVADEHNTCYQSCNFK